MQEKLAQYVGIIQEDSLVCLFPETPYTLYDAMRSVDQVSHDKPVYFSVALPPATAKEIGRWILERESQKAFNILKAEAREFVQLRKVRSKYLFCVEEV